jgi:hypothetical protein
VIKKVKIRKHEGEVEGYERRGREGVENERKWWRVWEERITWKSIKWERKRWWLWEEVRGYTREELRWGNRSMRGEGELTPMAESSDTELKISQFWNSYKFPDKEESEFLGGFLLG